MGNKNSKNDTIEEDIKVKLQTQLVQEFSGKEVDWKTWKKKAKSALGTTGFSKILYDTIYAREHPVANETVYHALLVALADGSASHLVEQYESILDGHSAWAAIVEWYDGDATTTESAEEVRTRLSRLKLDNRTAASSYINRYRALNKQLKDLVATTTYPLMWMIS